MSNDPFAGRGIPAPGRCRMLVATADGVFLWPGSSLVYRRGVGFVAAEPRAVNSFIGSLFGPEAIEVPIQTVLEMARDRLRDGHVESVQRMLDGLKLPRVSPNGARLMRTIAARQGLALPNVAVATQQLGTIWNKEDITSFARLYDGIQGQARELEKAFDPGSAWDPSKHPRWPAGQSDGGQFSPADSGGGDSPIHRISLGPPPFIPTREPSTGKGKNDARKAVGKWLLQAGALGLDILDPEFAIVHAVVQGAAWLAPYVNSYLDPPTTLEELQGAVDSPSVGYNIHHIVEQTPAEQDGFPRSQIDDPSNLVLIPTLKHWEVTAWFQTVNNEYGGLTPRAYLRGKDWNERTRVGLEGLNAVGVLKQ
jgi:hypothetical protein